MKKLLLLISLLLASNAWGEEIRIICEYSNASSIYKVDTKEKTIIRFSDTLPDMIYQIKEVNNKLIYAEHLSKDKKTITGLILKGSIGKGFAWSSWVNHTKKELLKPEYSELRKNITRDGSIVTCISD